jgi:hypothetical protein
MFETFFSIPEGRRKYLVIRDGKVHGKSMV